MHNHRAAIIVGAGLLILAWVEPIALARGADTPPASAHARAPRTLPAIVRPARDVILGAPQDGVLLSVLVSEGERVAQGQVLASLDDRAARAAVALAESEAARTADLRRAESDLAHARTRLERLRTSAQGGGASSMEIDDAQRAVDRAEADRDSAIERIESARQRLALERARLDQHAIAAPFAGVVVRVEAECGAALNHADPVLRLIDPDAQEAEVYLPAALFATVRAGQTLVLEADAPISTTLTGRIASVDPVIDAPTGTIRCRVELPNPGASRPAGFLVRPVLNGEQEAKPDALIGRLGD